MQNKDDLPPVTPSSLSHYNILGYSTYVFILTACPFYIFLYAKHSWIYMGLGFETGFVRIGLLDIFSEYLGSIIETPTAYFLLVPVALKLISIALLFTTSKFKRLNKTYQNIIELPDKLKLVFRYILKNIYAISLIFIASYVLVILPLSYRAGRIEGKAYAERMLKKLNEYDFLFELINLESGPIKIFTYHCNSNLCLGIESVGEQYGRKILISRTYDAKFYSKKLYN